MNSQCLIGSSAAQREACDEARPDQRKRKEPPCSGTVSGDPFACTRAQEAGRFPTRREPLVGADGGGAKASLPIVALLGKGPEKEGTLGGEEW